VGVLPPADDTILRLWLSGLVGLERAGVMFLAPWLVCALLAWFMWWFWQKRKG
jgi:hypothetical protein